MITRPDILKNLLSEVRKSVGRSLEELMHCLPKEYYNTEVDPPYLVLENVIVLIDWGLVEAYQNGKILKISKLEFDRWDFPKDVKFYVTKQTLDMEQIFGINLSSFTPSVFGDSRLYQSFFPDVFVLMPFDELLKPIYEDHVKKIFKAKQLKIGRADDFFSNGSIISDIWTAIRNAKIIVADCTGRNPNVFYEIGIAHTLSKETVLISQSIEDIPFDLRHLRIIIYEYNPRGMKEFEKKLAKTISAINKE
ncbi:hypothetical protein AGMMS50212_05710 [Spirochaetia bacterium]|nr:hypothetical protein AGMMS50212_05710 [Spirochaetia bacterium]